MPNQALAAMLSQAFTAFVIECDNEAERRLPHKTTMSGGPPDAPWLVSSTMYWNCLRWLGDDGLKVDELERHARTATNVDGMRRWGYVRIDPAPASGKKARRDSRLLPTIPGCMAREVFRPLYGEIEKRWALRFGAEHTAALSKALSAIADRLGPGLPYCMPILGYALTHPAMKTKARLETDKADAKMLGVMIARVQLAFALEFEQQSRLSMCMHSNVLRVLDLDPKPASELPRLAGISKEALSMAVGALIKLGLASQAKAMTGRGQGIWLTPDGWAAKRAGLRLHRRLEAEWSKRFDEVILVRELLEPIVGTGRRGESRLFEGLEPYAEGWRARVRACEVLPHFPAVLHRGGFPDGS